jgi:hypothetical protein
MTSTLVSAARPEELKAAVDALIAAGKTISIVVPMSQKTYYLIIHSV